VTDFVIAKRRLAKGRVGGLVIRPTYCPLHSLFICKHALPSWQRRPFVGLSSLILQRDLVTWPWSQRKLVQLMMHLLLQLSKSLILTGSLILKDVFCKMR